MKDFDLRKYLAEGKLLKEEVDVNKILSDGGYDEIDDEELLMTVKSRLKGNSNIDAEKLNLLVMKIEDEEGGNIDFSEGKLVKEEKTYDIYGDGDVVIDISRATPEQESLIRWESDPKNGISEFEDSEAAQKFADEIMNLNSSKEVKNYYDNVRGWATVDYLDTYKAVNAFVGNKPIQDEDLLAKLAIDILEEFRIYAESEDLIQYLNKSMDYLERIPSNDDVYSAIQAVADGLNPYTGEEFDYTVDEMQSELERLIA